VAWRASTKPPRDTSFFEQTAWSNRSSSVGCCKSVESALSCASVHARITDAWKPTPGLNWEASCWMIDLCSTCTSRASISRLHPSRGRLPSRRAKRGGSSAISPKSLRQREPSVPDLDFLLARSGDRDRCASASIAWPTGLVAPPGCDAARRFVRIDRAQRPRAGGGGAASAFPPGLNRRGRTYLPQQAPAPCLIFFRRNFAGNPTLA